MDRKNDNANSSPALADDNPRGLPWGSRFVVTSMLRTGTIDTRSVVYAVFAALGYCALAMFCLSLSRYDATLAGIWLPSASAVAMLLLARLRNEIVVLAGIGAASIAANLISGNPLVETMVFTVGNLLNVALVTGLTRRACGSLPDMTDLSHLGHFLLFGGLMGPAASAILAATVMGPNPVNAIGGAFSWFIPESMGMILIVPAILLIAQATKREFVFKGVKSAEAAGLIVGGTAAAYVVFSQDTYALLFLIPPITLLVAFRLGAMGTALFVPAIAALALVMSLDGHGPFYTNATSELGQIYVIQAFVAVNFLTGLPIAAILAGRERLTHELFEGRSELALLAENVTDAVLSMDNEGVFTYAAPSVREVLGREPEDFVGRKATDLTHQDASDRIAGVFDRFVNGEVEKERFTYRRLHDAEDGSPVFIEADCAVASDPTTGERSGFVVSARDVTDRVELELLLTRARRHAENAAQSKSEFLANMSHEIRTPMNGVLGFAELMLQEEMEDHHRRHTEMIVQSGRSMMMLLNDILDLSKIEAGQITIDSRPVDLRSTIEECAILHRPAAEKKGLKLVHEMHSSQPGSSADGPWVLSDALRLRQIILNLIGNAVKFTENGEIEIRCVMREDEFCIEVKDTGIGIPAERVDTIFAPFTQGENDTARRFGGTGLGLTISRQLAELLGGKIEVESAVGVGSAFRLTLPARIPEPEACVRPEPEIFEPVDLPQSARILLVEDHDVNRLLGTEMLERCGQSVAVAHDGNEAIAMVIDSVMRGNPYDLVLMDVQMPGCDGYAATRAIRAEGICAEVMPIVALTANAFPEDIAASRDAGMQAHLAKPLVFADLARALQRWLPTRIVDAYEDGEDEPKATFENMPGTSALSDSSLKRQLDALRAEFSEFDPEADRDEEPRRPRSEQERWQRDNHTSGQSRQAGPPKPQTQPQNHSPALVHRWTTRRSEVIEAVREALETGTLGNGHAMPEISDDLASQVHKLAGTAAMFGEPELGDHAAEFERALRQNLSSEVREALAFKLLNLADNPHDRRVRNSR